MDYIWSGIRSAFTLMAGFDREFWGIVWLTLKVSLAATALASLAGFPLAFLVAVKRFPGREAVVTVMNTFMALPTVAVGLLVYSFLSRRGPLGFLGLLHTPTAIIMGEFILALPIVTALAIAGMRAVDERVLQTAKTLGAGPRQAAMAFVTEGKYSLLAAMVAGFGRVVTEVGSAVVVGGSIAHYTRTMSTTIALETSRGELGMGMGLGAVLILLALSVNTGVQVLGGMAR